MFKDGRLPVALVVFVCLVVFVAACQQESAPVAQAGMISKPEVAATHADQVKRGEYLVSIMGCNDCHTPWHNGPNGPEPDMSRMLSGHPASVKVPAVGQLPEPWKSTAAATNTAFHGPWGTTYTKNLTPDEVTGIGIWTEEMFIKTIRTGRHMGVSRPIQPPMPWMVYRNATDEDLKAVFAYLRTIKPIHNEVPEYEPPPGAAPVAAEAAPLAKARG